MALRALVVVALALSVGVPAAAAAVPAVDDASCAATGSGTSLNTAGTNEIGQIFTAGRTGAISRAEMTVDKSAASTGDYRLAIYATDASGLPAGSALASATISNASILNGVHQLAA